MDLLDRPWPEIVQTAHNAIKAKDLAVLQAVDAAIRHLFLNQVERGTEEKGEELILNVFEITGQARPVEGDAVLRFITRWEHVAELTEAFRRDATAEERARRLVKSREHGERLLELVRKAGADGLRSGELKEALGLNTHAYLSKLLREFEEHDLIERRRAGKSVFVTLGLVGDLVAGRKPIALSAREDRELWEHSPVASRPLTARMAS